MKAIKNLIAAAFGVAAIASKGNHSFERVPGTPEVVFYYRGNPVCVLNFGTKSFKLDHCGYKTSSTSRVLKEYRDELTARGFSCSQVK